jgi:hypothetical protein
MRVLSIGDMVRPGRYALHSSFRHAANYLDGDRFLALVGEAVGPGPFSIVVEGGPTRPAEKLLLRPLDLRTDPARLFRSRLGARISGGSAPPENLDAMEAAIRETADPRSIAYLLDPRRMSLPKGGAAESVATRMHAGAERLRAALDDLLGSARAPAGRALLDGEERLARSAEMLAGTGFGLTPSGDDFLAGVLIGLHVHRPLPAERGDGPAGAGRGRAKRRFSRAARARRILRTAARSDRVPSDALLEAAARGRASAAVMTLLCALTGSSAPEVRRAVRIATGIGATSGIDFATGLLLSLRWSGRWRR